MFRRTLLVMSVAALCGANATAAEFSNTYFFGDSLTDSGSYAPFLPPGTGRFTTNPGPVWAENLAAELGTDATPATNGGSNFAQGGGRVTLQPGVPDANPLTAAAVPVREQVSAFLVRSGAADPDALYVVWAGANDIFRAIDPTKPEAADPASYLAATAGEQVGEIARLQAAGARYIIVPNVPDIGNTPFGLSLGPDGAAGVTGLVTLYNQSLLGGLASAGIEVIPLDTFSLLREVTAAPATYGLVNVTMPACGATGSLVCTSADWLAPDADKTFAFADGVHPTTAGHRLVSDYALGVIRAPGAMSLLAESPVQSRAALFSTIVDQTASSAWARSQAGFGLWVSAGASRLEFDSSDSVPGAKGEPRNLVIGADMHTSPRLLLGAALSLSTVEPDFAGGRGSYEQDERALALYAAYRNGSFHATVAGAIGDIDYDTRRRVALGQARRSMSGSTSGSNRSLGVLAGYDLATGTLRHGPIAGLHAQRVKVDGFSEDDTSSTGMSFGNQNRDSLVASLGYQVSQDYGRYLSYARLTVDRELEDDDRTVSARLATMPANGFSLPAFAPDRTYATAVVGVGAKLTQSLSGSLALAARFGQNDVSFYGLQASLSMGF